MTTIPDISVPAGASSTPVAVTAPPLPFTAPARTITVPSYTAVINGRKTTVPARSYTVPAYPITAPPQSLTFHVLQVKRLLTLAADALGRSLPVKILVAAKPTVPTFEAADYGALGNGVHDDWPGIQGAIDACYAAAGGGLGVVRLNAGVFKCLSGAHTVNSDMAGFVELKPGIRLVGAGSGLTTVTSTLGSHSTIVASQCANIGVEGLKAECLIGGPGGGDGIKFYACDDVALLDVVGGGTAAASAYNGIAVYGGERNVLTDCLGAYATNVGIHLSGPAINLASPGGAYGAALAAISCEAHHCATGFRAMTYTWAVALHRVSGVTWDSCNGHDNGANWWTQDADNLTLLNCFASNGGWANIDLKNCNTGYVHHTTYAGTGGTHAYLENCTNVVED